MGVAIVCMVNSTNTTAVNSSQPVDGQCGVSLDTNSSLYDMSEVRLRQCSHVHMYFTSCPTSAPH